MYRRTMLNAVVMLVMVFAVGCQESQQTERVAVWLAGDNSMAFARVGYRVTENNELGGVITYFGNTSDDPQVEGMYGIYHFDRVVEIINPFNQEEMIAATAYVGAQYTLDRDYKNDFRPFMGFLFNEGDEIKAAGGLFVEYQDEAYGSKAPSSNSQVLVGMRFRF